MLTTCSTRAEPTESLKDFSAWMTEFKRDAITQGVPSGTVDAALRNVVPLPHVLELDRRQPESTLSFGQYVSRIVVPDRIALGRKFRAESQAMLRSIADRYGVSVQGDHGALGDRIRVRTETWVKPASSTLWRRWPSMGGGPTFSGPS